MCSADSAHWIESKIGPALEYSRRLNFQTPRLIGKTARDLIVGFCRGSDRAGYGRSLWGNVFALRPSTLGSLLRAGDRHATDCPVTLTQREEVCEAFSAPLELRADAFAGKPNRIKVARLIPQQIDFQGIRIASGTIDEQSDAIL